MSRIVRVEMCRYDYRVTGRFKFLKPGADGVARRPSVLIRLTDEGILSPVEAEEFIALGMMDGIALKPARNTGLWYSRQIVHLLKENGLMVLGSGLTDPDLALASAIHPSLPVPL